jgi:hypothetical protein
MTTEIRQQPDMSPAGYNIPLLLKTANVDTIPPIGFAQ